MFQVCCSSMETEIIPRPFDLEEIFPPSLITALLLVLMNALGKSSRFEWADSYTQQSRQSFS